LSWKESIKRRFSKQIEEELKGDLPNDERLMCIAATVFCVLITLYYVAHQMLSTGFFTSALGPIEIVFLYGILIYWITASVLLLIGQKNISRDLDSFGGLIFSTIGYAWFLIIFPFDFVHFADVLPDFFRILLQWISNDIGRVILVLLFLFHLVSAIYSFILRVLVRQEMT